MLNMKHLILTSMFFAALPAPAQNLFLRGLLTADARECRTLYNPQTPHYQANLIGHWKMDGTVGAIANGATMTSGKSGGPNATFTIASSTLSYSATSVISQSVSANGTAGDILSAGTPAALADPAAATWMMWVKIGTGTARRFFYKSDNNSSRGYFFLLDTDNELKFIKVHGSTNMQRFTCPLNTTWFGNTWHQIVVTWDGSSNWSGVHTYIDGVELVYGASDTRFSGTCSNQASYGGYAYAQNGTGGFNSDTSYPLILLGVPASSSSNPASAGFSGNMDEFAMWNRVLTQAEITRLYNHQKCN